MPELSFGTHFFQDIVESNIFYLAIFAKKGNGFIDFDFFEKSDSLTEDLIDVNSDIKNAIKVFDFPKKELFLTSDIKTQKLYLFMKKEP